MGTTLVTTETQSVRDSTSHVPSETEQKSAIKTAEASNNHQVKQKILWTAVIIFLYSHIAALYGIYLLIFKAKVLTILWGFLIIYCIAFGSTAGAHRLWAHRCYKAKWQLRVILGILQTVAFQNSIYTWVRDHRCHHKFSETDADPHNPSRGFFFSHIGWVLVSKHPDVKEKAKTIDLSDLEKDFVVVFQRRYYALLMPLLAFVIPTYLPVYLWHEDPWVSWNVTILRWMYALHCVWLINSAAHRWGSKPFEKNIPPSDNISVSVLTFGEGFHNYHHVFPYDYKTAELGNYVFNPTTAFIDFFARIGWAYDLKTVSKETILKRAARTGDGTYKFSGKTVVPENADDTTGKHHDSHDKNFWGWGDADMITEDYKSVTVL